MQIITETVSLLGDQAEERAARAETAIEAECVRVRIHRTLDQKTEAPRDRSIGGDVVERRAVLGSSRILAELRHVALGDPPTVPAAGAAGAFALVPLPAVLHPARGSNSNIRPNLIVSGFTVVPHKECSLSYSTVDSAHPASTTGAVSGGGGNQIRRAG